MQTKRKYCTGCQSDQYIWARKGRELYCKSCWAKKSGKQSKAKPTKAIKDFPRARINKRSLKQVRLDQAYSVLRKAFLNAHPFCEAHIVPECKKRSDQVHHRAGKTGKLYLDDSHFLAVCFPCHRFLEENPRTAVALWLSELRLTK